MIVLGRLGEGHTANNGPTRPLRTNCNRYLAIRPYPEFYAVLSPCIRRPARSLPLGRPRRLAGDIVRDPIDPPHLIHDPPRDPRQKPRVERIDIRRHPV